MNNDSPSFLHWWNSFFHFRRALQQWLDQKFSMFIHFGLYSVYGGVYDGKPVTRGYSEQIQSFAGIFSDWYGNTARRFNPVKWNLGQHCADLAKSCLRSIVFTSKHHDGFACTIRNTPVSISWMRHLTSEI